MTTEKPVGDRVKETVELMRSIKGLGIPLDCSEVAELRSRLNEYIKNGTCWEGTIDFLRFGRMAEVSLPRRADKVIEVKLRVPRATKS
jgi:hypothetical protein